MTDIKYNSGTLSRQSSVLQTDQKNSKYIDSLSSTKYFIVLTDIQHMLTELHHVSLATSKLANEVNIWKSAEKRTWEGFCVQTCGFHIISQLSDPEKSVHSKRKHIYHLMQDTG